jgi:hypothetical protein
MTIEIIFLRQTTIIIHARTDLAIMGKDFRVYRFAYHPPNNRSVDETFYSDSGNGPRGKPRKEELYNKREIYHYPRIVKLCRGI